MATTSPATKKPRPESLQARLGVAGSEQLRDALLAGMSYRDAIVWLRSDFGVSTSLGGLSDFFDKVAKPYLRERISTSARIAEAMAEADGGAFDAGTEQKLKQLTFEILISNGANPEERKDLLAAYLKLRAQETDRRKLALLEAKARKADEAERAVTDTKLTEAERAARLRQIFGMG